MKYTLSLGGIPFSINTPYKGTYNLAKDYFTMDSPLFHIDITKDDIEYEKSKETFDAPLNYLETLSVYRKFAEISPLYHTFLIHGSSFMIKNTGFIILAHSGTGKSTHSRLLKELLKDDFKYINDDKPLIHIKDHIPYVYGTPWDGKERLSTNTNVILKGIIILNRSDTPSIESLSKEEAYSVIYKFLYKVKGKESMEHLLSLYSDLISNTNIYNLYCNTDISSATITYNKIKDIIK